MSGIDLTSSRVLVVDDHRIFVDVLAARLRGLRCFETVDTATTLDEARTFIRANWPDLVLVDYHLGEVFGPDLLGDLAPRGIPVAVISSSVDPVDIMTALEAGVDGWLAKHAGLPELLTACEALLRGQMFISPLVVRPLVAQWVGALRGDQPAGTFVDALSPRELEVLRCLMAGLTRADVARRLFLSPNTVRTHVQNLFKRAEVHSTLELIARARSAGVRPIEDGPTGSLAASSE